MHSLDAIRNSGLKKGDTFICCDAGGGTGDIISYEIDNIGDDGVIKVEEAAPGTGDLCGGSFVNNKFRKFFIDKFQEEDGYDEDTLEYALHEFEQLKRDFTGEGDKFPIRVPGLRNIPSKNVKKSKLTLTLSEMESFHSDVINILTTLVKAQLRATKNKVKAVLLVGGFGQSVYVKREIKLVIGPEVDLIQPLKGQVAIARGAMLHGFSRSNSKASRVQVESRVARKAFGMRTMDPYRPDMHQARDKIWDGYDGFYRVSSVTWFMRKGDKSREDEPVIHKLVRERLQSEGKFAEVETAIHLYEGNDANGPPDYPIPEGMRTHVILRADLSGTPVRELRKKTGADRKKYYCIDYEIRCKFFSAHTEYSLWLDDRCYGKVKAEYE